MLFICWFFSFFFYFKTELFLGKPDLQNEKSKCIVPQTWFFDDPWQKYYTIDPQNEMFHYLA